MNDQEWSAVAQMIDRELESIASFADEHLGSVRPGGDGGDGVLVPTDQDFAHLANVLTSRRLIQAARTPPLDRLQANIVYAGIQVVDTFSSRDVGEADKLVAMQNLVAAVRAARVATGEEE